MSSNALHLVLSDAGCLATGLLFCLLPFSGRPYSSTITKNQFQHFKPKNFTYYSYQQTNQFGFILFFLSRLDESSNWKLDDFQNVWWLIWEQVLCTQNSHLSLLQQPRLKSKDSRCVRFYSVNIHFRKLNLKTERVRKYRRAQWNWFTLRMWVRHFKNNSQFHLKKKHSRPTAGYLI